MIRPRMGCTFCALLLYILCLPTGCSSTPSSRDGADGKLDASSEDVQDSTSMSPEDGRATQDSTGDSFDLNISSPCEASPCLNKGTCIPEQENFNCDCEGTGFMGTLCQEDINECSNAPCNVGTCNNLPGSFECICPETFTGPTCDTDIDECADSPCQNEGLCINEVGAFSCDCTNTDFVGQLCDEPVPYHFIDVTAEAGLSYMQSSVELVNKSQLGSCTQYDTAEDMCGLTMTGGAVAADFDNDGFIDLFVTRVDDSDILFRNKGDGSFEDISAKVGLTLSAPTNGVVSGDLDNDGDQDLYLSTMGGQRFYLLINQLNPENEDSSGTLWFTEEAETRGAALSEMGLTWGMSLSVGDYDLDGWLDIHTTEWHTYHDASGLEANHARLLRNKGASNPGHFEDTTDQAGVGMINYSPLYKTWQLYSLASSFSDFDLDGWPDLIVTGDYYTSRLFWNQKDGTFSNGTSLAGINGTPAAMGSAIGDIDGDGLLDWFVSSLYAVDDDYFDSKIGNRLYRNNGDRSFKDITDEHIDVHIGYWGWGTTLGDFDNDGDLDLVLTNGQDTSLDTNEGFEDFYLSDPMRYWENIEGVLTPREEEVGLTDTGDGKGLLKLDYDNDGDLDIFITRTAGPPLLYRNSGSDHGDFLRIKLRGTLSNRDGFGARIQLQEKEDGPVLTRELRGANNFLSQDEAIVHFGMKKSEAPEAIYEIRIQWPGPGGNGATQILEGIERNATIEITEPL